MSIVNYLPNSPLVPIPPQNGILSFVRITEWETPKEADFIFFINIFVGVVKFAYELLIKQR